jgi:hypothetical protein
MAKRPTDKNVLQGVNWRKVAWKGKVTPEVKEWNPEAHPNHQYHGAPVGVREDIQKQGILGRDPGEDLGYVEHEGVGPGVYTADTPEPGYGSDIWAIKGKVYPSYLGGTGDYYIPGNVHVSDIKRVGHWWTNPKNGGEEVHWHREENCHGMSIHDV